MIDEVSALVDGDWLEGQLGDAALRVVDARWFMPGSGRCGRDEYDAGHIPGAVFVDLDGELSGPPGPAVGRHPLPDPAAFAATLGDLGIGDATHVVAYDDHGGAIASRLWWLLRFHGHARASVLDGGIAGWIAAQRPLSVAAPAYPAREFTRRPSLERTVTIDDVERLRSSPAAVLLDARGGARYRGEAEPLDPRPGHIPGALNAPFADNLDDSSGVPRMRPVAELAERFAALGVDGERDVVVYCGSGVTACHDLLAMHLARQSGALYVGSWSQWCSDPERPVATGEAG